MRPILFAIASVNQRSPSGATVIPYGPLPAVGVGNSVISPVSGARRPTLLVAVWANQMFPSRPADDRPGTGASGRDRKHRHTAARNSTDPVSISFREPDVPVGRRCDLNQVPGIRHHDGRIVDAAGGYGADRADPVLNEPELLIGAGDDRRRRAARRRNVEFHEATRRNDPTYLIRRGFREPDSAIGPCGDSNRKAGDGWNQILGNGPEHAESTYLVRG